MSDFLTESVLNNLCDELLFTDEIKKLIKTSFFTINNNKDYKEKLLAFQKNILTNTKPFFNDDETINKNCNNMFNEILLISLIPILKDKYNSLKIPPNIIKDTLTDLKIWIKPNGKSNVNWLINSVTGKLHKIGRLQFMSSTIQDNIKVYKNKENNQIIIFADNENFIIKDNKIIGNIIENTIISNKLSELVFSDYKLVLENGNKILEIHVQEGEPLKNSDCKLSLEQGISFYKKYFPDDYKAFTCESWLLGSGLEKSLPNTSNVVQFCNMFNIYSYHNDNSQTIERVFGDKVDDYALLPEKTSMQIGIKKALISGVLFNCGYGFILID